MKTLLWVRKEVNEDYGENDIYPPNEMECFLIYQYLINNTGTTKWTAIWLPAFSLFKTVRIFYESANLSICEPEGERKERNCRVHSGLAQNN